MPVTITDLAHIRAEKAIAAHIRGHRDSNADTSTFTGNIDFDCTRSGALLDIGVYEGRNTQKRESPAISVIAQTGTKEWEEVNFWKVPVMVTLYTHRHEDADSVELAEVVHNTRIKALHDLLCDEATLQAALNKPDAPDADLRAVDDFYIEGLTAADSVSGDVSDELITEVIELEIFCYPFDPIA